MDLMSYVNHDQALLDALQNACDYLEAQGVDVSGAMKRRDKREPARREKEQAEIRMERVIRRIFKKQKARVELWLQQQYPAMPLKFTDSQLQSLLDLGDDDELGELVMEFIDAMQGGVNIFAQRSKIDMDWSLTNAEAAKRAKEYAYKFVKGINSETIKILQLAISAFVETPGFTISDVMNHLTAFDPKRALVIARTEITRAYAHGQLDAGRAMQELVPDIPVIMTWVATENPYIDEQNQGTCELCDALDGEERKIGELFYEPENEYQDGYPPIHPNCSCHLI